jgi:hypothetical protein
MVTKTRGSVNHFILLWFQESAEEFCRAHALDARVMQPLAAHIAANLQKVINSSDRWVCLEGLIS